MDSESSEPFRNVPNPAEPFGTVPTSSEPFRTFPNRAERKESHTLTAWEATRMFERASVARTERSIINWCQPNKLGVSRLDCFFDTEERKYFITPQSVELAIQEELAKAKYEQTPTHEGRAETVPNSAEREKATDPGRVNQEGSIQETRELRAKIRRLTIEREVSKQYIERLETEREKDRELMLGQSYQIGSLETQLKQLEAPRPAVGKIEEPPEAREVEYDDPWEEDEPASADEESDNDGFDETPVSDTNPLHHE